MKKNPTTYFNEKIHDTLLEEGIFSGIFAAIFAGTGLKRLSQVNKLAKSDPEFKAALIDYAKQGNRVRDLIDTICSRSPDLPNCKNVKSRKYHRK